MSTIAVAVALLALTRIASADPNDWVNVHYVVGLQQSKAADSSTTTNAQNSIVQGASTSARNSPWSVTNTKGVAPPSGDGHDYLSWAPYHWPNCNWCPTSGRTHLVHSGDGNDTTNDPYDNDDSSSPTDHSGPSSDGGLDDEASETSLNVNLLRARGIHSHRRMNRIRRNVAFALDDTASPIAPSVPTNIALPSATSQSMQDFSERSPQEPIGGLPPVPTQLPTGILSQSTEAAGVTQTQRPFNHTPAPAQAPAKTAKEGKSSCTPSPTSSLPPSATWTRCPYVPRDGQVNPDVRELNGPNAINSVSQSVLYNAFAYSFQKAASFSQNAASYIDTFFLNKATLMNPNMKYGQIVRGPGTEGQMGTFTGILDLRGIVKIINGIMVLKAASCPDWTSQRDQGMLNWMKQYSTWLTGSDLGKNTASRVNNHNTFYVSQVAATKMFIGDNDGALAILKYFFAHQYLDQVAQSGEQPFEAVRTRPFHYRCFNLEALITNAKLGDQLGYDFWTAKSKYGATIQTAVDFLISKNPGDEDGTEAVPHVAAIASAYGDPDGKYKAYLEKTMPSYQSKPFWLYDQPNAFSQSPRAKVQKRTIGADSSSADDVTMPFQCSQEVFGTSNSVELDDGIYATCDELQPFYDEVSNIADA